MVLGSRRRTGRDARQATEPRPAARTAEPPRYLAPIAPASGQGRHRACARQPPRQTTTAAARTDPEAGTRTQPEETRTKTAGARGTSSELEEVQAHAETQPREAHVSQPKWLSASAAQIATAPHPPDQQEPLATVGRGARSHSKLQGERPFHIIYATRARNILRDQQRGGTTC